MTDHMTQRSQRCRSARALTEEELEERRRRNQERNAQRRASETAEQREARLRANRERNRARRQAELPTKRQKRLETDRIAHQVRRATEGESADATRRGNVRVHAQIRRDLEDAPTREARQSAERAARQVSRALENTPTREARQHVDRTATQAVRATEDTPTRRARQRSNREATEAARDLENTPEQRERRESHRLSTMRSRASQLTPARSARQQANRSAMREARRSESTPRREARRSIDREARRVSRQLFVDSEESEEYLDVGQMDIECPFCRALHFPGERLKSSSAARPLFSECCGQNKVCFPPLPHPPEPLKQLLTAQDTAAARFRNHIRAYNNALCMASVAAKGVAHGPGRSNFNPTITIQGRIYHYMGPLLAPETRSPAFLSVYIHDTDYAEQTRTRMGMSSELNEQILIDLKPYANGSTKKILSLLITWRYMRIEGQPVSMYADVAVLIPGNEDGAIARRDIVVRRHGVLNTNGNEVLDSISVSHRSYDALSYVLLFPDGRDGWYPELRLHQVRGTRTKVTPLMFYSWQLFQRSTKFSTILHACRLFQQYLVDQYCKVEAERLSYIRRNQQRLRAADYTHLREQLGDAGRGEDEADAVRAGRLFILPSTYIGGDRYMRQQMHDIIAISNKVGHPDIFLTITCNPNWKDILNALLPGQTPRERPDLCARVFKLKHQAMMSTVIDNKLFGTVVAYVRVIEFQKRGLPHAHVIFFLDERSKNDLRNPINVDRIISAEIPPDSEGAELHELGLKHMVQTPCGDVNTNAVCMGECGCKKFFPKKFLNATSQSEDDYYVQYSRRSPEGGGQLVGREVTMGRRRQRVMLDNSWVVPHNRKLLRMFTCHINAELCVSRVGWIKYLFKYVCKGSDRVTMELIPQNQRYDEIGMFQDARYVSASEAAWRLLSFNIVNRNPNVVRLDVHLANHHTLIFEKGEEHAALARSRPGTKLTEWFAANQNYPGARYILYHEYCRYFTWNASSKTWNSRARLRRGNPTSEDARYDFSGPGINVVGRIYTVSPR